MLFYHNTKHALGGNLGFPLLSTVPGPEQNTAPGHPCSVLLIFILKTNFIIRHFEFTFTEHFNKMILTVLFLSEKIIQICRVSFLLLNSEGKKIILEEQNKEEKIVTSIGL